MMYRPVSLVVPAISLLLHISLGVSFQEFCERESFVAQCLENHVILIKQAVYGRMSQASKCVKEGPIGCQLDVRYQLNHWCSGRASCSIPVADFVSAGISPCDDDYRSYLQASYDCVPAIPVSSYQCQDVYHLDISVLYVSSVLVAAQNCGTMQSPLTVRASSGQKLSIRLLDFSSSRPDDQGSLPPTHSCHSNKVYTVLKDVVAQTSSKTLCAGDTGDWAMVETVGNQVEVRLYTDINSVFMLKVQATGCADPPLSNIATVARDDNTAKISCPGYPGARTIYCSDGQWVGDLNNCTTLEDEVIDSQRASVMKTVTLSEEISVLIITMVALFVGVVVLTVGIICLKRYTHQRQQPQEQQYWPPPRPDLVEDDLYKPGEGGGGPNNEYYRTWQLQHHHHQQQQQIQPPAGGQGQTSVRVSTPHPTHSGGKTSSPTGRTSQQQQPYATDHIYESPKFDRDSVYSAPPSTLTQSSSYFDLNTTSVRK